MKYEVGDKILVLHSNEEGTVVELMNENMVMIEVDKVRFPVYMDQIDFPYFKMFSKSFKKESFDKDSSDKLGMPPQKKGKKYVDDIKREKTTAKYKVGDGVWLSFLPVFDKDI